VPRPLALLAIALSATLAAGAATARPASAADIPFTRVVIDPVPPDGPDTKTVGDVDGDGFPDVIVASSTGGGLWWYRYPAWTRHAIRPAGGWTTDMQAGDVDGDGDLDIVVPRGSGLMWYVNPRPAGDPAAGPWAEIPIGVNGADNHDVEVGDVNGDGKLDVVSRRHGGAATYLWLQQAPAAWIEVVVGTDFGEGTALGDVDGDGDLDVAQNGFWLENPLPLGDLFAPWPRHVIDPYWLSLYVGVLVADVNGDGRPDVVLAPSESADGPFSWYEAADPKSGPWTEHPVDPSVSYFHTFKAADVDGDGDLDLVTAEMHQSADPDEVSIYRNEGGGLAWAQQVIGTMGSHNLRIADIDADGDVDVVGVNWHESAADGAAVTLWRNGLAGGPPLFTGGVFVAIAHLDGPAGPARIVTGPGPGRTAQVRAFDADGAVRLEVDVYPPGFAGGVRVAACDFDADGRDDVVAVAGPGGAPHVRVMKFDGSGALVGDLASFFAYDLGFAGGLFVACGDLDGDGAPEIVLGVDAGGGPHVRVLRLDHSVFDEFLAYDPAFRGGIRVAVGDVTGDGRADLVLGAGPGGGPHVRVVTYAGGPREERASAMVYDVGFRQGLFVAAGDVTGDGVAEIVTSADAGGGPHVRVLRHDAAAPGGLAGVSEFLAYDAGFRGGVRAAAGVIAGGGRIVTGAGSGGGPHVGLFTPGGLPVGPGFLAY
jgi:hypothetical protein